jgi:isopentenyl diphosphate isomerase/L-lactate dehydrogenase-like FMN-dependent dehydrogenase
MGLFHRQEDPSSIEGPIGYFGLAEWWLATFTEAERKYIDSASSSPTGGGPLTEGRISYSSGRAAQFLSALATNFNRPGDRRIARMMLSKAEELAQAAASILDLHFVYMGMIKTYHADRDADPEALRLAVEACEKQIALAPESAKAWEREYPGDPLPAHTGYTQLAIVREKQRDFAEAINLSRLAMRQGWTGNWAQRIARNEKRLINR